MNLISDHTTPDEKICPTELPETVKAMIRQEYEIYDENRRMHDEYERLMIDKVKSMKWKTGDKFTSGDEILKLLTTVPGIGMINAVIWLAFIDTHIVLKRQKSVLPTVDWIRLFKSVRNMLQVARFARGTKCYMLPWFKPAVS